MTKIAIYLQCLNRKTILHYNIPFLKFSNKLHSTFKNGKVNLQQYKNEIFCCENIVGWILKNNEMLSFHYLI